MVSRYDSLRHRIKKLENTPVPRQRPLSELTWWEKMFREMSPDDRNAFFDRVMNKTRHLTRKDTQ
jgi:hypothetical protein